MSLEPDSPVHASVRTRAARRTAPHEVALRFLAALAVTTSLLLALGTATAQEATREQVTVSGEGVVYGEPDEAVLELGVEATDADARSVIDATNRAMSDLRRALEAEGIAERDVRTIIFDLYREEPYGEDGEPQPVRYRLVHLVEVTVRDVDAVGDVLVAAVEAGADRIGGVRFGLSDPAALEVEARTAAVEDARTKAEGLARAAGREIGRALRIEEGGMIEPPQPMMESRMMAMGAGDAAPVSGGQLAVRVRVTVTFALE